jgi:hypothetical protein
MHAINTILFRLLSWHHCWQRLDWHWGGSCKDGCVWRQDSPLPVVDAGRAVRDTHRRKLRLRDWWQWSCRQWWRHTSRRMLMLSSALWCSAHHARCERRSASNAEREKCSVRGAATGTIIVTEAQFDGHRFARQ